MSDLERNLKIGVNVNTTKTGPDASAELGKTTEAAKKLGKESKDSFSTLSDGATKAVSKNAEVKRSIQLATSELGVFGRVVGLVTSGTLAAWASLGVAIGQMRSEWSRWLAAVRASSDTAAQGIGNITQAAAELELQRIRANEAHQTALAAIDRDAERQILRIREEMQAVQELTTAREKAELAGAKTPEERESISRRYADTRRGIGDDTSAREIAVREEALGRLAAQRDTRAADAEGAAPGLSPERVALKLQNLPKILESLDKQIAETEQQIKDIEPGYWMTLGMMGNGAEGFEQWRAATGAADNARATLKKLRGARAFYSGLETPLTAAQVANKDVASLDERISIGRGELDDLRVSRTGRQRTNRMVGSIESGNGPVASLVDSAASGAEALLAGGTATPGQADAISRMVQMLNLQKMEKQTILQMLGRMNDNDESFLTSIKTLSQRVNAVESKLADSMSR